MSAAWSTSPICKQNLAAPHHLVPKGSGHTESTSQGPVTTEMANSISDKKFIFQLNSLISHQFGFIFYIFFLLRTMHIFLINFLCWCSFSYITFFRFFVIIYHYVTHDLRCKPFERVHVISENKVVYIIVYTLSGGLIQ